MAADDPVSRPGNGSKIGLDQRSSQVSDFPIAHADTTDNFSRPHGEFLKMRHYVQQMRGRLIDKEA